VIVLNFPPAFYNKLENITIAGGSFHTIYLPNAIDEE